MIALIKPILFKFLGSTAVKELVVKLLEAYSKTTDNTVDDKLKKNITRVSSCQEKLITRKQRIMENPNERELYPRKQPKRVLTSYTTLLQRTFYAESRVEKQQYKI